MTNKDESLLDQFRGPGLCEYCGRPCLRLDPHHIFSRGMGGGSRLDHRLNLMGLGGFENCNCHGKHHNGKITREELIKKVAAREGMTPAQLKDELHRLLREPNDSVPRLQEGLHPEN